MKKIVVLLGIFLILAGFGDLAAQRILGIKEKFRSINPGNKKTAVEGPTPTLVPNSPTPTIVPKTFEEINRERGPCANVTVLMYHHIQDVTSEMDKGQKGLSVSPARFKADLEYLKEKGYQIITMRDLNDFFAGRGIAKKSAIITLDDAYEDNYTNAFSIAQEMKTPITIFTPTGLVDNPGYLTWKEIEEMNDSGLVYFGNHTWSHQSSYANKATLEREISTARTQLAEKGLDFVKVFAYPYGSTNKEEQTILNEQNYNLAFTTKHGTLMCAKDRLALPRIRVGGAPLSSYGL